MFIGPHNLACLYTQFKKNMVRIVIQMKDVDLDWYVDPSWN